MENEIWKDIEGYEGLYQVSDQGRVRSLNYNHTGKIVILKPQTNAQGYYFISLYKKKKVKLCRINRLVAQAFIPNPDNKPQVNHLNEIKTDNRVCNLEWCTCKYNINYGDHNKKVIKANSKPVKQMTLDGTIVTIWASINEAGRSGFEQANICDCCNGKRKTHRGYLWAFV